MATKPTLKALKAAIARLLELQAAVDEAAALEKQVKADMVTLGLVGEEKAVAIDDKGRVFVSEGERISIPVELAKKVLGATLAKKVIDVKTSVSNKAVEILVKAGDITPKQFKKLDDGAAKTPVISLYVRPLK